MRNPQKSVQSLGVIRNMQHEEDRDDSQSQSFETNLAEGSSERDVTRRESALVDYEEIEEVFVGPFPHPEILAQYEDVMEGSAERIMSLTERQFAHRQSRELSADATIRKVVESESLKGYLGLAIGAVVAIFLIACGTFLVFNGHDWAGTTMVVSTIASIVGVFVYGTRTRRSERRESMRSLADEQDAP